MTSLHDEQFSSELRRQRENLTNTNDNERPKKQLKWARRGGGLCVYYDELNNHSF